jgi:hypothetical protein
MVGMAGVGRPGDGHLGFFLVLISTSWQFKKQHVLPTAKHQEKMVALPLSYAAWDAYSRTTRVLGRAFWKTGHGLNVCTMNS